MEETAEVNERDIGENKSDEDSDEDDEWVLELEKELELDTDVGTTDATQKNNLIEVRPVAIELPMEILVNIMTFVSIGRVSKAWSMAMSTVTRRNFASLLTEALRPYSDDPDQITQGVEPALFEQYGSRYWLTKGYGRKARQILFNLKDSRNHILRTKVISGEISFDVLVRMNASDMANPQLVQQRKEWLKKRTHEVMRDSFQIDGFTESDMFECRSCGSTRTRYRQWRRKAIVDRVRVIIICLRCPYRWEL